MLPSTSYKVGALSDLISSGGGEGEKKKRTDFSGLFTTAKRQREPEVQPVIEAKISNVEEEAKKKKKKRKKTEEDGGDKDEDEAGASATSFTKPSLKSLVRQEDHKAKSHLDEEKESRTVFVGNLPASIKKKKLRLLFSKFGSIDSVRLRCAARPDLKTTKKVAVIKKTFHEGRTNINAYVRFAEKDSAERSCVMNGSAVDGFVIRVDSAWEPTGHEPAKGIFLGNLGFALEEDAVRSHFARCGEIADVRLIRDAATGIGKGFGYVNFEGKDGVALAMELNGSVLGGRPVRIERCQGKSKGGKVSSASSSKQSTTTMTKKKKDKSKKRKEVAEATQFQGRMSEKGGVKKKGLVKKTKEERRRKIVSRKLLAK